MGVTELFRELASQILSARRAPRDEEASRLVELFHGKEVVVDAAPSPKTPRSQRKEVIVFQENPPKAS